MPLKEAQRQKLLEEFRQGASLLRLSAKYGVSKQAIASLARNRGVVNETKALMPTAAEVTLMLHRCGLTPIDAGAYLRNLTSGKSVDYRTVKAWTRGRSQPRWEQWKQLLELCERQDRAADEQLTDLIAQAEGGRVFTVQVARTRKEAERFGWPSVDAHLAVIRRIVERAPKDLRIVPTWSAKTRRPSRSRRS